MKVPIQDQVAAIQRELGYRQRVYSRLVGQGKMTQTDANYHIHTMEAVLETLQEVEKGSRLL